MLLSCAFRALPAQQSFVLLALEQACSHRQPRSMPLHGLWCAELASGYGRIATLVGKCMALAIACCCVFVCAPMEIALNCPTHQLWQDRAPAYHLCFLLCCMRRGTYFVVRGTACIAKTNAMCKASF